MKEVLPLRNHYPLGQVTVITISGKDRLKWLNNLVTNDLKAASDKRTVECFVTDVKGRTLSHGIVFADRETLVYFSWGENQASRLIPHWDRYIIREDIVLADESSKWWWALAHRNWLESHFDNDRSPQLQNGAVANENEPDDRLAVAWPAIGDEWFLVRFHQTDSLARSFSTRSEAPQTEVNSELEALRIRHRWPLFGIDFDEKNLPQEMDRNATAISFHKGCYLGQETVARLDALGQVQKKLVLLKIDTDRQAILANLGHGTIVSKGEHEAGVITSCAIPGGEPQSIVALAMIRRAYFEVGTELSCEGVQAVVAESI